MLDVKVLDQRIEEVRRQIAILNLELINLEQKRSTTKESYGLNARRLLEG